MTVCYRVWISTRTKFGKIIADQVVWPLVTIGYVIIPIIFIQHALSAEHLHVTKFLDIYLQQILQHSISTTNTNTILIPWCRLWIQDFSLLYLVSAGWCCEIYNTPHEQKRVPCSLEISALDHWDWSEYDTTKPKIKELYIS